MNLVGIFAFRHAHSHGGSSHGHGSHGHSHHSHSHGHGHAHDDHHDRSVNMQGYIIIHSKYFPVSDWLKPHA